MVLFLLLLVSLATVSHVSGQATPFTTTSTEIDIKACPFKFFGKEYQNVYVDTSGNKVSVCFKGKRDTKDNDCLLVDQSVNKGVWYTVQRSSAPGSEVHTQLSQLTGTATCLAGIKFSKDSTDYSVEVQVGGKKVTTWETKEQSSYNYKDASGCRHSGAVVLPGKKGCGSDGSAVTCSASAVSKTTPCGSGKKCEGEGLCVTSTPPQVPGVCTVTGSTVIDVAGKSASVPDRCAYTLMSETGAKLHAVFKDRHRSDVSFLDHVILQLDEANVKIHLEQGGRVTLKGQELTLSSKPVTHHGVELTKDQTGVTAKLMKSKQGTSVFFDGYTAQIYTKVPSGTTMPGLCGKSSRTLSDVKVADLSSDNCDKVTKETDGNKFECTEMTKRCDLLKNAPFDSCHSSIKPDPYIKACTDTLCKYPAVDGLKCQFLQAYVKACSLLDKKVENWRTSASCSSDKAFCQDTFCSDDEFCAEDASGGTSCLCRPSFASEYRTAKTFGKPTVCDKNSASVSLARCLMEEQNVDYSVLHLNDKTCTGRFDEKTHMVTFDFKSDTCGTELLFKNYILAQDSSGSKITRHDEVKIELSCYYDQTKEETMSFKIKSSSVTQTIVSGPWEYTLTMNAFTDASRTQAVSSSTEILLDQTIWMELKTAGLDDTLVAVVTDSCWATKEKSPAAKLKYDLIKSGCPDSADKTVKVESNGEGTTNYFSFNMFQFSGKSGDVYLHCKINLCVKKGNTCAKTCGGSKRRRRSARNRYVDVNPAFITMQPGGRGQLVPLISDHAQM
ncbi:uncharacterized protein LOC128374504 [Scomber japonicus]|uniref:uncharacterized protein LOC128374504 n=1 Tax=Scomber japonicus TaxID=13676 RepID=UPI002304F1F2|nr:uncharacterized protein LOC128374504 [Scomber japonicus]